MYLTLGLFLLQLYIQYKAKDHGRFVCPGLLLRQQQFLAGKAEALIVSGPARPCCYGDRLLALEGVTVLYVLH